MRSSRRRCLVHIGAHKTGTTTIQHALSTRQARLAELGYLYPRIGRPAMAPHGHHNIAWEISNDYRYAPDRGSVADLFEEICASVHDVILSSEDFEISAYRTERFEAFINGLSNCGLDVVIVFYVRNQIDYARSLYLALVGWGLDKTFGEFIDEIVENGQFHLREWTYPFDYDDFVRRLQGINNIEVMVRSYDSLAQGEIVADFLSIVDLNSADLRLDEKSKLNEHRSVPAAAELFYSNRTGHKITAPERSVLAELLPPQAAQADLSAAAKLRLIDRFGGSNERLCERLGLAKFDRMDVEKTGAEAEPAVRLEDIFRGELIGALQERLGRPGESSSSI